MDKIIVLGAGLVGKAIAIDLCRDFEVTVADVNKQQLDRLAASHPIETVQADLADEGNVKRVIDGHDLVIGALPGFMGFDTLKYVIESAKNIVDISFFAQDPFALDELAKQHGVTAVIDCGVAPGMSHIILGYHNSRITVDSFTCYVGGLPVVRTWPFQYKAPFSPLDVIEEYTRPARLVENGRRVIKPALSERELIEFDAVGTLEAFNTDGLRTLLKTMTIPDMKEKTLRYPGHIEYIEVLKASGFFDATPTDVNGSPVRPIDVTAKLLQKTWRLAEDEEEFTVMRIILSGRENDRDVTYTYDLFDRYDQKTGTSSMARTTGYTCTAVAHLVAEGKLATTGIIAPEFIGAREELFREILDYLRERGVHYRMQRK